MVSNICKKPNLRYNYIREKGKGSQFSSAKRHVLFLISAFSNNNQKGGAEMIGTKYISDLITDPNVLI